MRPRFKEEKATQVAAVLLNLRGGRMSYMKLIKLMYLVDRSALIRWGRPVTYDNYVSMKHGPVLSRTLDLINEGLPPGEVHIWGDVISAPENYEVFLKEERPSISELSEAEVDLISEVFNQYGHLSRWEIVNFMHEMIPEWQDPGESATPIDYRDILVAEGIPKADVEEIVSELNGVAFLEAFIQ